MSTTLTLSQAAPVTQRYFYGFSTQKSARTGVRTLYDIDLVNIDLMTSFMTRVGERVMRPDWGCKLWDYVMEPFTPALQAMITAECLRICSLDTRVTVVNENVQSIQSNYGFKISMVLLYQPWLVTATFAATFEQSDAVYYGLTTNNLIGS